MSNELKRLAERLDLRATEWRDPIREMPIGQQVNMANYAVSETLSDIARQIRAVLAEKGDEG